MQEPRRENFATDTGFNLAKWNYEQSCQKVICDAALSDGKVTKGYFTKRKPYRRPSAKNPDYPPCPRKGEFQTVEEWQQARNEYSKEVSRIKREKESASRERKPRATKTGIVIDWPKRKHFSDVEEYNAALKEARKQYSAQWNSKKREENEQLKSIKSGESEITAVEIAKAYLSDKISAIDLQRLIDEFVIQLALKHSLKESENIFKL